MHEHLENYLRGKLSHYEQPEAPLFNGDVAGRIANSGKLIVDGLLAEYGSDMLVEAPVEGMVGPLPYLGFVDMMSHGGSWIGDHKSSGNLSWAATSDDLARDFQLTFYAMATGMYLADKPVNATHVYYQTKNGRRSLRVDTTILPRTVGHFKTIYESLALAMYEAASYTDRDGLEVEGNPSACGDYKGCPYALFCPFSKSRQTTPGSATNPFSGMSTANTPEDPTMGFDLDEMIAAAKAKKAAAAAAMGEAPAIPVKTVVEPIEAPLVATAAAAALVLARETVVAAKATFRPPEVGAPEEAALQAAVDALVNVQQSLGAVLPRKLIEGVLGAKGIDKAHMDRVISMLGDVGYEPAPEGTPAVVPPIPEAKPAPAPETAEDVLAQVDGYDSTDAGASQALADIVAAQGSADATLIGDTLRKILGVKRLHQTRIDSVVQIGVDRDAFGVEVDSEGKVFRVVGLKAKAPAVEAVVEAPKAAAPEAVEDAEEVAEAPKAEPAVAEAPKAKPAVAEAPKAKHTPAPAVATFAVYVDIVDTSGGAVDFEDWLAPIIDQVEFEAGGVSYQGGQYNEGVKAVLNKLTAAMVKGSIVAPAELTMRSNHPLYSGVLGLLRRRCSPRVFCATK